MAIDFAQAAELIGRTVYYPPLPRFPKFLVLCQIKATRTAWGRVDVLIRPLEGEGEAWINADNISTK